MIFEKTAHAPMIDEPAAFEETVLQFLDEVDPRESTVDCPDPGFEHAPGS